MQDMLPAAINGILLAKAVVSISIVVALSLIAERVGPRAAGLLTGLPLGAGMVIIFTGGEQGVDFAAGSAGHMVPSFVTTAVFIYLYAAVAARQNRGGIVGVLAPSLAANVGFGIVAWGMSQTEIGLALAVPMVAVVLLFTHKIMAYLPNTPIAVRVRFGWGVLAFRAGMASSAIVTITALAGHLGEHWTALLTAYPLTLYPFILVIHITYRGEEIAAVLKHVPLGLGSVVSFCITASLVLPVLGLALGAAASFAAAFTYLLAFSSVSRWWRGRNA